MMQMKAKNRRADLRAEAKAARNQALQDGGGGPHDVAAAKAGVGKEVCVPDKLWRNWVHPAPVQALCGALSLPSESEAQCKPEPF